MPIFDWIARPVKRISHEADRSMDAMVRRNIRRLLLTVTAGTSALAAVGASAQDFVPTETEWAVWPQYCQARYVDIPMGQATQYANRLSRAQISAIEATIRPDTYLPIHHYCFAIGYMMRAKLKSPTADALEYKFLLRNVIQEGQFTFRRMDLTDPIAAEVAYLMATAHSLLGELSNGVKLLEQVVEAQPQKPGAYVALALVYRRNKNTAMAFGTVERAFDRVTVPSAELYYTAAMAYIDKGELEAAQNNAVEAYKLGYPLPGLKRKLAKLGYWPPKTADIEASATAEAK